MITNNFSENFVGALHKGDIKFLRDLLSKEVAHLAVKQPHDFAIAFEKANIKLPNAHPKTIMDAFLANLDNEALVHNVSVLIANNHDLLGDTHASKNFAHVWNSHSKVNYNDTTPQGGGGIMGMFSGLLGGGGSNSGGSAAMGAVTQTAGGAASGGVVGAIAGAIGGIAGIFSAKQNRLAAGENAKAAEQNADAAHENTKAAMYAAFGAMKNKAESPTGMIIGVVLFLAVAGSIAYFAMRKK